MERPIVEITPKLTATVNIDDLLEQVEETLTHHNLSTVLVLEHGGECFGVIGAVDLVNCHHRRLNPSNTRAWEVCTHRIVKIPADTSIEKAAKQMVKSKVHHLVVADEDDIIGVVSAMDILEKYFLRVPVLQ